LRSMRHDVLPMFVPEAVQARVVCMSDYGRGQRCAARAAAGCAASRVRIRSEREEVQIRGIKARRECAARPAVHTAQPPVRVALRAFYADKIEDGALYMRQCDKRPVLEAQRVMLVRRVNRMRMLCSMTLLHLRAAVARRVR